MRNVFVDTSGFYAVLDESDHFHRKARSAFEKAESEEWNLFTTNYVVHESLALIQARLGWDAADGFLDVILPRCIIEFVDHDLHRMGLARCRQARERRLSLTDCISFEFIKGRRISHVIANDEHFTREKLIFV